ncbi:serine hydrolase domain-containing protein [Pseudonocardia sp. TRM90224]|uniref:serine hydrolase domain-containing protein n=1 Tax=Pseudonocardia sp. TRM90224 TaxID=2812678 RepID=UPI001E3029FC|nr:serine hydrolase domain-containing protein [Pseudonocardia sp. TRM90224]
MSRRVVLTSGVAVGAAAAVGVPLGIAASHRDQMPAAALPNGLDELVRTRMAELKVPGAAVGILADGIEHVAGFGVTNVKHPLPVDGDTLFQTGSIGKTYTGTAIARLVEDGRLDLGAPVRTYLPGFRVADDRVSREVTVRHLVTHTAGWFGDSEIETGDGDDALARYVEMMATLPQIAPLGEHFSYNNAALCVAGRIVEVVTGQTYEAAIGALVLAPLGLGRTSFFAKDIMTEAFAAGHELPPGDPGGEPEPVTPWALPRSGNPAGGMTSSARDMVRYGRFHLGDGSVDGTRVLGAAALRGMQEPFGPGGSEGPFMLDGIGLTWHVTTIGGRRAVMHAGSTNGQQSNLVLVPERGFAVVVLTNAGAGLRLAVDVVDQVLDRFLGLRFPRMAGGPPLGPENGEYVGDYEFGPGTVLSVGASPDRMTLSVVQNGQEVMGGPLTQAGPDRAVVPLLGVEGITEFVRDRSGSVAWVRFSGRLAPRRR